LATPKPSTGIDASSFSVIEGIELVVVLVEGLLSSITVTSPACNVDYWIETEPIVAVKQDIDVRSTRECQSATSSASRTVHDSDLPHGSRSGYATQLMSRHEGLAAKAIGQ
jgi:hypothetical protein